MENFVGYAKSDLMIPEELDARDLRHANELARDWMQEVNAAIHSEICDVPAQRLEVELELLGALPQLRAAPGMVVLRTVDRLSCVRFDHGPPTRWPSAPSARWPRLSSSKRPRRA